MLTNAGLRCLVETSFCCGLLVECDEIDAQSATKNGARSYWERNLKAASEECETVKNKRFQGVVKNGTLEN